MSHRGVLALVVLLSAAVASPALAQTYRAVPLKVPTLVRAATPVPTATPLPVAPATLAAPTQRTLPVLRPPVLPQAAAVVAPVAPPPPAGGGGNAVSSGRAYVGNSFGLTIGGVRCGFVRSVEGGGVVADVIPEPVGPDFFRKKHLGPTKYEDLTLQMGLGMALPVHQWIAASWNGSPDRRDGAIAACDHQLSVKSERQFYQSLLIETTVPACDGSSKEPAYLSLRIRPQLMQSQAPAPGARFADVVGKEQKAWLPSNFRLVIDNLDCSKVSRVDSFLVRTTTAEDATGERRFEKLVPGRLEYSNLRVTLPEVSAETWVAWHQQFVVLGVNDQSVERQGRLELLSPNLGTVLATIRFYNLGIFRLAPARAEPGSDQISKLVADLYCERMEFVPAP